MTGTYSDVENTALTFTGTGTGGNLQSSPAAKVTGELDRTSLALGNVTGELTITGVDQNLVPEVVLYTITTGKVFDDEDGLVRLVIDYQRTTIDGANETFAKGQGELDLLNGQFRTPFSSTAAVIFRGRNSLRGRELQRVTPWSSRSSQLQPVERTLVSKAMRRRPLELLLL